MYVVIECETDKCHVLKTAKQVSALIKCKIYLVYKNKQHLYWKWFDYTVYNPVTVKDKANNRGRNVVNP